MNELHQIIEQFQLNKLRTVSKFVIICQGLDLITTYIGWSIGLEELNPLCNSETSLILIKLMATLILVLGLELKKPQKIDFIVPLVSGLVVPWNIFVIVVTLYYA